MKVVARRGHNPAPMDAVNLSRLPLSNDPAQVLAHCPASVCGLLASELGLSPHHFARVFKATFGVTPHRYVQARRLEAAADALQRQRQRPIADIALAHGFASQAHMTDLMRRRFGVPPRLLRQRG